jgi:hypothetical protein
LLLCAKHLFVAAMRLDLGNYHKIKQAKQACERQLDLWCAS